MGGLGGRHPGVVGVTAGMGIITYILCNVSRLCSCSYCCLTIGLDMWCQRQDDDLRRSGSRGLDGSDGRFPDPKERDPVIYSLAIGSNYEAFMFTICASLTGLL